MEGDGICAEVLFPDTLPPFFPSSAVFANQPRTREDYERRFAGIRAHNRWAVDFCAAAPGQRKSPVQVFLYDIDDAVAEIQRGHEAGLSGVLVPGVAPNHPLEGLWSKRYDPIWALCEELDEPVVQHVGAGTPDLGTDSAEGGTLLFETFFYAHRSLSHLIFGGVFERYPELKFVMTEEGLSWTIDELRRLDHYFANIIANPALPEARSFAYEAFRKLSLKPSEYFRRNCYIGASFLPPSEIAARTSPGVDHVMWGSDFPHNESTYPFSREALRATFASIPDDECRKMLSENAAAVYGFDLDLLAPIAARVGPLVEETHVPLEEYPAGSHLEFYMGSLHPEPGDFGGI